MTDLQLSLYPFSCDLNSLKKQLPVSSKWVMLIQDCQSRSESVTFFHLFFPLPHYPLIKPGSNYNSITPRCLSGRTAGPQHFWQEAWARWILTTTSSCSFLWEWYYCTITCCYWNVMVLQNLEILPQCSEVIEGEMKKELCCAWIHALLGSSAWKRSKWEVMRES